MWMEAKLGGTRSEAAVSPTRGQGMWRAQSCSGFLLGAPPPGFESGMVFTKVGSLHHPARGE